MEHPGLTSHEKWILQGVTFAFLIYCLFRMFIVGETLVGSSILLRFLATAIYGVPWVHAVAKWWSVISSISFVASEMNCFIQTRRMLKEMPSDFEDFDKTKRVLGYLIEANAAASVAGIYSLFYIIYGYFTLDCFAIFGGSIAFKAYASVFAITFARSSRTITATHNTGKESSSVASAHGNKYLAVSAETGSIESSV
ncbi:hypothetical protein NEOLI_000386 [Neolecta irregularis DAH-3]|uniref:Uncharacterized protein n=1 Tax=Neolecta irregularis (strain DAH-3) TaxID=1198029 RepID=A0A1U7LUK5_NEOID|nr:hypothetical protein NEOLI_000386 [Neolecta irregularis DAH-3]|eukprot:OLL26309.1 hypothetical protein NEOLI_000386 [Neolecta irregularis DAH-3]